jgi:cytochrome oxidase assembly protein ShyY1
LTATVQPAPVEPRRPGIRAILTPGWLAVIGLALAFAAGCWGILAPWQFARHSEREAQNAQIAAALAAPAVPAADLLRSDAQPDPASAWRSVTATGTFLSDQQVYVRLRQAYSQDAREVVLPFQLTDGRLILVDRGYALAADLAAGRLPEATPVGQVTIVGRISADQPDPSGRPNQTVAGRAEVYGIDSAALIGDAGPRGFVLLSAESPGALITVPVPERDAGPFLSYALQWLVFGAVAVLAAGVFAFREVTVPRDDRPVRPTGATMPPSGRDNQRPSEPAPGRRKFEKSQLYDT